MLDLYQLRYFLEAAREQNFAKAARALRVSPPAISQSIALLERSAGRKLFHRRGRRVSLTAEGQALRARAERIFDEVEAAEGELSGGARAPGRLRLASRELVTNHLLPRALRGLPGVEVSLHALGARELVEALLKDRVDAGYFHAALPDEQLESVRLGRLSSRVYAAPSLLRRLGRPKTPAQTLRLPFVAPRPFGEEDGAPSADGFPDERLKRVIRYRVEFLETHRVLAVQGLCAAVLPEIAAREDVKRGRLVALPGPAIRREIWFFKRKGRVLPSTVEELNAALHRELRRS